jgi:putative methyltransferase (TIGR04325 family)
VKTLLKRLLGRKPPPRRLSWLRFDSYEAAAASTSGYALPELLEVKVTQALQQKAQFAELARQRVLPSDRQHLQNRLVFEIIKAAGISGVYELGGSAGNWAFILNAYFENAFSNWKIQETSALVNYIQSSGRMDAEPLRFTDSFNATDAENRLFMAQGALQYLPDPLAQLRTFFSAGFPFIYLTRTPVLVDSDQTIYACQRHFLSEHAPGVVAEDRANEIVSIPLTLIPEKLFFDAISDGYEVVFRTDETVPREIFFYNTPPVRAKELGVLLRSTNNFRTR